jgi:hypothetical protein
MTDPTAVPAAAQPAASKPGSGLAIAGIIIDFFIPLLGLILSIVAKVQSKNAGVKNTAATVGIVLGIIIIVLEIGGGIALFAGLFNECASLGAGVHVVSGVTYTCS